MDSSQSIIVPENETLTIAKFPPNRFSEKIGTHPDFIDESLLPKTQYICSIFLDIKGSTRLALKYDLETVQKIKMLFFQLELKLLDILVVISTDFKEMQFLLLLDIVNF